MPSIQNDHPCFHVVVGEIYINLGVGMIYLKENAISISNKQKNKEQTKNMAGIFRNF